MQHYLVFSLFTVLVIVVCSTHGSVKATEVDGECGTVGKFCDMSGSRNCCPPHECKMLNEREGACVRGESECLPPKSQCQSDAECCSQSCVDGNCKDK
uniref:Uncharacterized protein n=1 Tax=Trichobilharzia regenti TaxID=157069 RepID=A0AA85K3J7_TRIRE|nr:unnamed protein product [Trichobilharzia regenti]